MFQEMVLVVKLNGKTSKVFLSVIQMGGERERDMVVSQKVSEYDGLIMH